MARPTTYSTASVREPRNESLGTDVKQLPGYGLKALIRPGTPGHLGTRRGPEGEGTIPTFSPGEKVAEGPMRAALSRRLCFHNREVITRLFLRPGPSRLPIGARFARLATRSTEGQTGGSVLVVTGFPGSR